MPSARAVISRRQVLAALAIGPLSLAGAGGCAEPRVSPPPRAAPAPREDRVEPLARTLETADKEKALSATVGAIRAGQSYEDVLSAVVVAGARQIRPRPYLGPMYHSVLMMHSIDSASRRRRGVDRWKPVLWAVDTFKDAQEKFLAEKGEPLGPPPRPSRAATPGDLAAALEAWDEAAADQAITSLCDHATREEIFAVLFRYGARDYRDIGHKSILVAGAWRLLQTMDLRRAQPLLRSIALGLLRHEGPTPPRDPKVDGTWARNQELARLIGPNEESPPVSMAVTRDLLATFRTAADEDARKAVVDVLRRGAGTQSVWDAIACGAAELVLDRPRSLLALHAVTTTDALSLAAKSAAEPETRRLLLLHAVGRLVAFRDYSLEKDGPAAARDAIDGVEPLSDTADLTGVLSASGRSAALLAIGYLERRGDAAPIVSGLHDSVLAGAANPHDYKLCEAVLEQLRWLSPTWRPRFLSASLAHLTLSIPGPSPRIQELSTLLSGVPS
jgi:hypothetical protein